jgi:hypothetical protein
MLAWNRYVDPVQRKGRREELSVAFSGNDGITWSVPQIVAMSRTPAGEREGKFWISYPYLFEATPGEIWLSTMQGDLRAKVREAVFASPVDRPLDGRERRVLLPWRLHHPRGSGRRRPVRNLRRPFAGLARCRWATCSGAQCRHRF